MFKSKSIAMPKKYGFSNMTHTYAALINAKRGLKSQERLAPIQKPMKNQA